MASEGTVAKVADRLSQSVLSVYNLTDLIRNTSPIEANSKLPKELLAKAPSIKNTGLLLQQMPGVITALDAHSDKSLLSLVELESILVLLKNNKTSEGEQSTSEQQGSQQDS